MWLYLLGLAYLVYILNGILGGPSMRLYTGWENLSFDQAGSMAKRRANVFIGTRGRWNRMNFPKKVLTPPYVGQVTGREKIS